jgi:glycosyltransferase involved in cell wall biosynthesis
MRSKLDIRVIARLRRLLDAESPDILHTFLFHANIVGRAAALLALDRPAVIAGVRVAERRRRHLWIEGWTSGLVDKFVAVSAGVRSLMIRSAGIPSDKVITIPNGVDRNDIPQDPADIRAELKLPSGCPVVVTVGRLTRQKGQSFLIEAAGRVLRARPDVQFVIIGDGPLARSLKRQAERLGIAASVHFLGWRKDAWPVMAGADVFVLPSLWEGMPNALLEAMAAGVPVVGTYVAGTSEVVENDKTGLLVSPGDARVLAQAISGLLMNPERARDLGQAGRERVLRGYTVDKMVLAHEELYERLMRLRMT